MSPAATGEVELALPADWCDLLLAPADSPDEGAATDATVREHLGVLVRDTWPNGPVELWSAAVDRLLAWRNGLLAGGVVSHGVVSAPRPDGTHAAWQVLTSVVEVPVEPEVDLTAVLIRLLEVQEPAVVHLERYETDMGLGVGLVALPQLEPPDGLGEFEQAGLEVLREPVQVGMAAALAWEPGAPLALLVAGMCLAPDQVSELAGLVAVIAGRSRLRVAQDEPEDRGEYAP